jgi:hypothetical protein
MVYVMELVNIPDCDSGAGNRLWVRAPSFTLVNLKKETSMPNPTEGEMVPCACCQKPVPYEKPYAKEETLCQDCVKEIGEMIHNGEI